MFYTFTQFKEGLEYLVDDVNCGAMVIEAEDAETAFQRLCNILQSSAEVKSGDSRVITFDFCSSADQRSVMKAVRLHNNDDAKKASYHGPINFSMDDVKIYAQVYAGMIQGLVRVFYLDGSVLEVRPDEVLSEEDK